MALPKVMLVFSYAILASIVTTLMSFVTILASVEHVNEYTP